MPTLRAMLTSSRIDSFALVPLLVVCRGGKFARSSFQLDALPNVRAKVRLDARASSDGSRNAYSPTADLSKRFSRAAGNATDSANVFFAFLRLRPFPFADLFCPALFRRSCRPDARRISASADVAPCLLCDDSRLLATSIRNDLVGRSFGLSNDGPVRTLPRLARAFAAADGCPKAIHLGLDLTTCVTSGVNDG